MGINIQKKDLWLLSAVMIFLLAVGYVLAYTQDGSGTPSIMGHSIDELEGVQKEITGSCAGQVMIGVDANGIVQCETDDTGGTDPVTGSVLGLGSETQDEVDGGWSCSCSWGECYCFGTADNPTDNPRFYCNSGTIKRCIRISRITDYEIFHCFCLKN